MTRLTSRPQPPWRSACDEALKAVNPAQIWGVGDKVGSIEEGKWVGLMITDGDPLDLDNKHRRLYEKYSARP
jgi:imidazolonepropionase-like amidohydrolase